MSKRSVVVLLCALGLLVSLSPEFAQDHPAGPPQFVTVPILSRVAEAGLDHGHFVFGEGAALPSPLAPDLGAALFQRPSRGGGGLTLTAGAGTNVSDSPSSYEGETGAAAYGTLAVGGSNHIFPGACGSNDCFPYAYASTDGGITWSKTVLPRVWNGTNLGIGFDPSADYDANGTFYFGYGVAPLSGNYPNGIVMVSSSDGANWKQLTPVTFNKRQYFDDKYYLAVDRSSTATRGRIYISWDRNQANNQILYIAYSSDGGTTWSAPVKVNDGRTRFERVIGAYPAVDQNSGVVYDAWQDYAKNIIFVDKSSSGGASWGTDVAAAVTHTGFGQDIGCVGGRSQGPAHHLKVGPSGALYLVYADSVQGRGFDILLTKSTNGGATWSSPVVLNDDSGAADQFHPTLSVESNSSGGDQVTVSFYDRRDDPNNCLATVYATRSTDGGATWAANVRALTASYSFDGNPNGPGDYSSSTPYSGGVFPLFSDHRADFEIYTLNVH